MNKLAYIIGGGTVSHVRNHLALCAPAYGTTARAIENLALYNKHFFKLDIKLVLTKMADPRSKIETYDDMEKFVDEIIKDERTKIIFFNPALVDFRGQIANFSTHNLEPSGKYETRLSSNRTYQMSMLPYPKIVDKIRKARKDITLVAFKTTCGATEDEQYIKGLNLLKSASCNLVLANDTKTRVNMIITPEEARYHVTTDRNEALKNLVDMAGARSHLTFTRSTVVDAVPVAWASKDIPDNLRKVVEFCVSKGAYKPFRGATVGHFAVRLSDTEFLTSMRKTNFNDIAKNGLVYVKTDGPDSVIAYGAKPSVGGQSQRIVFKEHPGYDCIVHFHCPKKPESYVPTVSQRDFECGSHECGQNTSSGLQLSEERLAGTGPFTPILSVFLENHGPNIVFSKDADAEVVCAFIERNFDLTGKTGGYVNLPELK